MHYRYIYYKRNNIAFFTNVTAGLPVLNYLPSLVVRKKDHVMSDVELDVQMGVFILGKVLELSRETCDD